jgi:hypothetical protein
MKFALAVEERAAMSPDSLTGLEANLRFASKESMLTRIFGRLICLAKLDLSTAPTPWVKKVP